MGQARRRGTLEARIMQAKGRALLEPNSKKPSTIVDPAYASTAVLATRRIFFNHLNQSIAERGHWHVDQMYGSGTGIVIKHEEAYYLLTAGHVIHNACKYEFTNESPFWVIARGNEWPEGLEGWLMPGRILHIGDELADQGVHIDATDLVLVELFYPNHYFFPDQYIDLDRYPNALMTRDEFIPGMPLIAAGYPFHANDFMFFDEERADKMTHATVINRWVIDGLCNLEKGEPSIIRPHGEFPPLSGASGGIVTNYPTSPHPAKMAGLMLSASSSIVRFIPSYMIARALTKKASCRITPVDPAFKGQPDPSTLAMLKRVAKILNIDFEGGN